MQINSSLSSASSLYNMDEMDSKLSASILSSKDTDSSGDLSATELGVSASQVAQFDTDGDGVLSTEELTAALKAQREQMQAQMQSEMSQSSQLGMLQSTLNQGGSTSEGGAGQPPSVDDLLSKLFSDTEDTSTTVSASSSSSASAASNSGSTLSDYLEQLDAQMAETIMSLKDTDEDGQLSAEELGATASQISELDTDGDGVLSESELTTGLKAERETMMAENGGVMPPPPPPSDSTSSSSTGSVSSSSSTDMDTLISGLFASSSTSTDESGASASTLADFMLRQRASNAYQSMDNLIAGLFADSGAASQSVSVSA